MAPDTPVSATLDDIRVRVFAATTTPRLISSLL